MRLQRKLWKVGKSTCMSPFLTSGNPHVARIAMLCREAAAAKKAAEEEAAKIAANAKKKAEEGT